MKSYKQYRESVEPEAGKIVPDIDWGNGERTPGGKEYGVVKCPKCGGVALNGDPHSGFHFRGSGKCLECKETFSICGLKLPSLGTLKFD